MTIGWSKHGAWSWLSATYGNQRGTCYLQLLKLRFCSVPIFMYYYFRASMQSSIGNHMARGIGAKTEREDVELRQCMGEWQRWCLVSRSLQTCWEIQCFEKLVVNNCFVYACVNINVYICVKRPVGRICGGSWKRQRCELPEPSAFRIVHRNLASMLLAASALDPAEIV